MVELTRGTLLADRYRVVRVLGQGGMGMVLEVMHEQLGGRFALKLMHAEPARDSEMLSRFENEARLAARIMSPHLVRVTDLGRLPSGEPFLVMDYLEGLDLEQIIEQTVEQKRWLTVADAVQWVLEASVGLAQLHAAGSVHRDVKPSNLFLATDSSGRQLVKVLDFGLARAPMSEKGRLTTSTSSFGTPLYMAPEQFRSARNADARADQHALAHVLFELLTGEPAFWGDTPGSVSVAIATQPAALLRSKRPDAPEEVERAIAKAMAKRPEDRFPTLGEFAMALAKFGGPEAERTAEEVLRVLGLSERNSVPAGSGSFALQPQPRTARSDDETAIGPPELSSGSLSTTIPLSRDKGARRLLVVSAVATTVVLGLGAALGLAHWGEAPTRDKPASEPSAAPDEPLVTAARTPDVAGSLPQPTGSAAAAAAPLATTSAEPPVATSTASASSSATPTSLPKAEKSAAPLVEPARSASEPPKPPETSKPVDPLSKYGGTAG